jgi:hypothetical protein
MTRPNTQPRTGPAETYRQRLNRLKADRPLCYCGRRGEIWFDDIAYCPLCMLNRVLAAQRLHKRPAKEDPAP